MNKYFSASNIIIFCYINPFVSEEEIYPLHFLRGEGEGSSFALAFAFAFKGSLIFLRLGLERDSLKSLT